MVSLQVAMPPPPQPTPIKPKPVSAQARPFAVSFFGISQLLLIGDDREFEKKTYRKSWKVWEILGIVWDINMDKQENYCEYNGKHDRKVLEITGQLDAIF